MAQSQRIVDALKRALKAHGVSYAQVARRLELSESSVKRLFSTGGFSLARLEAVCDLVGLDLLELARQADAQRFRVPALTVDQEQEFVGDPALLLVAVCALNRWPFERILDRYRFTEPRLVGLLARLDRMGLIELLPGNRIRLRIARNFAWLPDGPDSPLLRGPPAERVPDGRVPAGAGCAPRRLGHAVRRVRVRPARADRRADGCVRRIDQGRRGPCRQLGTRHLPARRATPVGAFAVPGDAAPVGDALVASRLELTHHVDALVASRLEFTHHVDALVASRLEFTHHVDALVASRLEFMHGADGRPIPLAGFARLRDGRGQAPPLP